MGKGEANKDGQTNFLEISGAVHLHALTLEAILMAFCKTGVFPFSPDVVTTEMMVPSLEMSYRRHLPLAPPMLVCAVTDLLLYIDTRQGIISKRMPGKRLSQVAKKRMIGWTPIWVTHQYLT